MAILSDQDLFDFDGYARRLTEVESTTQQWAQSTVGFVNRSKSAYDEATEKVKQLQQAISSLNPGGNIRQATEQLAKYDYQLDSLIADIGAARKQTDQLTGAQRTNQSLVQELSLKLASLHQRYQALDPTQKGYEKQQRAILNETRTVTRAIDAQSKSLQLSKNVIQSAENSYTNLKKQTNDLKRSLDHLPDAYNKSTGKINEQNRAAVALNAQYQKNIDLLGKIERGQNVFGRNVGNYPKTQQDDSSLSPVALAGGFAGKAVGAGLALAGLDSALSSLQKVGEITLQFDSLDSALKVVSNDTALFAQRQAMLSRISEDLGQDLATVEGTYTLLTASSKGTRLEGEATDKIFESVVGTMGRLKRPSEDVSRALLAVGQMMSKGTIQSEELKGQLAETLPGSFNVAAKAIGVTTAKLTEMLKNGEVIASDFLPKFAAELDRTFNPNHERRVEGLGASLARLRNEGVEWVKGLNIGESASVFVSNITSMARSVREFFSSSLEQSTNRLYEQTDAVNRLESQLPALLTRYDELKGKTKLSADEQKELQTVVNSLVSLVPSAATGFDIYGNALDVNKGKVLSFTGAQQALNAELNKAAIADLRKQTGANLQQSELTQRSLNKGTKQQSFNFKPYFLRSDEEKRMATDKNSVKNREVALSDDDRTGLQRQLQEQNKQVELSIIKRLQLGDKLSEADEKFIAGSANSGLKQTKVVAEYNDKIAELNLKQGDLLIKGDEASRKQREIVLKELKTYQDKKAELLSPKLPTDKPIEDEDPLAKKKRKAAETARKKAQTAADQAINKELGNSKGATGVKLADLSNQKQDGLVAEQEFLDQRKAITLAGIDERQGILTKAGRKETDDFKALAKEKLEAETAFQRDTLKLNLSNNKAATAASLATLDGEGTEKDEAYVEKRHQIVVEGIEREQAILTEAGQANSELYRKTNQALLDETVDYHTRRIKAAEASWKQELANVKQGLKDIDTETEQNLSSRLGKLQADYNRHERQVKVAVAKRVITEEEGEMRIYGLKQTYLADSMQAVEDAYQQQEFLETELTEARIRSLEEWKDEAIRTPKEILAVEAEVARLRAVLEGNLNKERKRAIKEAADFAAEKSDEQTDHEVKNAETAFEKRQKLYQAGLELAGTIGSAIIDVSSANSQRDIDVLDRQKERELNLAGDNADAKARIEEQYAKRKAEIQRKSAEQERAAALFSIAINTAQAIMSVLSTGGGAHYLDFGVSAGILSAFVTAAGIAQAAAVLAKPLPTFWTGTSSAPEGLAELAERGPELRKKRDGSFKYYSERTVDYLDAGDRIYTADQTSKLVADWQKQQSAQQALQDSVLNNQSTARLREGRQTELRLSFAGGNQLTEAQVERAFARALDSRPTHVTELGDDGRLHHYLQQGHNETEYLNRRNSLPK